MILTKLALLALTQLSGLPNGEPEALLQGPLTETETAELLGLIPVRPTGNATGPVLTIVGSMGVGGFLVELQNSPTSFAEEFFVQLPPAPSKDTPSPLLVAFHKFGSTALDIPVNTTFEQECYDRNWFLVAPLGASTKSFSSIASQLNTEVVIELMLDRFRGYIDPLRLYGVGFSMGGGNVMNYAARHVDPSRPMFAAIIDHSGALSLRESYGEQPANQFIMELWFGGDPTQFPFEYARSSVLDIYSSSTGGGIGPVPIGGGPTPIPTKKFRIAPENSLITNLSHVPLYLLRATNDPQANMSAQMDLLAGYLTTTDQDFIYKKIGGITKHQWATLNAKTTFNWLAGKSLQLPTRARTIADRDDTYFYFDVKQELGGSFTRFDWSVFTGENRLHVLATENLASLGFDVGAIGLDASQPLSLRLSMADSGRDLVRITGYDARPAAVLRNGEPTRSWRYDAVTRVLYLQERVSGQAHHWRILPE